VLQRIAWFAVPIFVLALTVPGAPIAAAAPTLPQMETVSREIDVAAAAGAISSGVAKSLKVKIVSAAEAVAKGDVSRADRVVDAFLQEVDAQDGRGIAASAAELLTASVAGEAPRTVVSVSPGHAALITTEIGGSPVVLALPSGTPVAWIRFGSAGGATVAQPSGTRRLVSLDINAFDSFGRSVTGLGANAQISIGFDAATSVDALSARISTLDASAKVERLVTTVTGGADAMTATASTTHFSPFVLDALTTTPPWRFTYAAPATITAITPSTGSICGNTTVVLTGSGFSGNLIPEAGGIVPQSFTVDSDTRITMLTSAPDLNGADSVAVSRFLTVTALAPEFANTRIDFDPSPLYRTSWNAIAGVDRPGTPTYTPTLQTVLPRITGLTPNQGPTIGAPVHASQDFTNAPIRVTGCGFTGATAVLFGATASPSFTVQNDAMIFATPPTPGSGSLDVRVVTAVGTSGIIPIDRFTYVKPPTIAAITPSIGSVCGNTTVVLTGSGFSGGTVIPEVNGVAAQTFTVDSDTQITLLTSVGDPATVGNVDVGLTKFLTSTALAPEFANTRIDSDPSPLFRTSMNALAGPGIPGTATYTAVVQSGGPRVSGLTPNQGPTIGAPAHPSQDFTNAPIRITGCGFTGATAVLFSATPSPTFTVQSDAIIFATPPTPGSGSVDVRVVTPVGTSGIIPIDRFTYVAPPTITGITPSAGSICGNTTVVVTGSGLSGGNLIPEAGGVVPQRFTVDSDTQMTILTSVGDPAAVGNVDISVSKFFTSTALAPEFANTRIDSDPSPLYRTVMNALAGPGIPGTATYTAVVQSGGPRVSGLTPNQGPAIGAPAHPSQDFTNAPIRITGCGFTGATAVLFGAIPSLSFSVQDDTIVFATPPTPGIGTVDVRAVTPVGISSIIP